MGKKNVTPASSVITISSESMLASSLQKIDRETETQYGKEFKWSEEYED